MKRLAGLVPLLVAGGLFAYAHLERAASLSPKGMLPCEVVPKSIHDGDTLRVDCGNGLLKVRSACVDAPELKQSFGVASRDHLRSLVNESQGKLKVQVVDTDRYGRSVAELRYFSKGKWRSLQEAQARAGTVWAFERFKRNCSQFEAIAVGEREARRKRLGLWASENPISPWDWRRTEKL